MNPLLAALPTKRKLVLLGLAVAVLFSWAGSFDRHSQAYLDEALLSGGLVYATARGINAAVSVLQGTEITPAVATFSVGQVLDPVNDLIERFSAVLLLALGSLALQKILLEIFSHSGFSILLTLLALGVLLTALHPRCLRWYPGALRLFMLTALLRFALSLVVIGSGLANQAFLETADTARHSQMTQLETELRTLSAARPGSASADDIDRVRREIDTLRDRQGAQRQTAEQLGTQVAALENQLAEMRREVPLTCRLNPFCDEGERINAQKTALFLLETELNAVTGAIASTAERIAEKDEYLQCALRELAGEACSFLDRAYSWLSPAAWTARFDDLGQRMDSYASNMISLLVSFLVKTILLPLLLLYGALALYRQALRALVLPQRPLSP